MREVPFSGLDPADIGQRVIAGEKLKDSSIVLIDQRLAYMVQECR